MSRKRARRARGGGLLPDAALPDRGVPRRLRVERDLHEQLSKALRHLRDARVSTAIITRVQLTDDLAFARIYVRPPLEAHVDPKALVRTLELASSRLRREVGRGMALRKAPEFRFIHDSGIEAAERVEELLEEIRHEASVSSPGDASGDATDSGDGSGDSTDSGDGDASGASTEQTADELTADELTADEPTADEPTADG